MDSVVDVRECEWCHEPYHLSDGRYKYYSDECAEKAKLARRNGNFGEVGDTMPKSHWEQYREEYWQSRMLNNNSHKKTKRRKRHRSRKKNFLNKIGAACLSLGKPNAADEIVDLILKLV